MNFPHFATKQPLSSVWVTRLLLCLVIVFALVAGYYRSLVVLQQAKYSRLETKYQLLEQRLPTDTGATYVK